MTLGPMDTTSANKTNPKQASLFWDHLDNGLGSTMVAQAAQNMSPNSPFTNYLHNQEDFPTSMMSVGKTLDDGTVSVFTKEGVNVFKEEDILITCKSKPILINTQDNQGQY